MKGKGIVLAGRYADGKRPTRGGKRRRERKLRNSAPLNPAGRGERNSARKRSSIFLGREKEMAFRNGTAPLTPIRGDSSLAVQGRCWSRIPKEREGCAINPCDCVGEKWDPIR